MKLSVKSLVLISFCIFSLNAKKHSYNFECGVLCPAMPCFNTDNCCYGSPFASASVLFWQTKQGNMDFAAKNEGAKNPQPHLTALNFEIITPDFIWKTGVKVRLGYHIPVDGIDVQSKWTYFTGGFTRKKKNVFSTVDVAGQGIIPLWYYQFLRNVDVSPRYEYASGNWQMSFNSIDLEFGRYSYLKPKVKIRPHAGMKIAWINQTYKVEYERGNLVTGSGGSFQLISSNFVMKNNSAGVGPRVGVDSRWKLCWGFSLIGDGAFSLIYDYFRVSKDQIDFIFDNTQGELLSPTAFLSEKFSKFQPVLEIGLGIDWGTCFCLCNRKNYIGFTLAYDTQYWWSQNQMRRLVNTVSSGDTLVNNGDMQPHGLSVSARFDF